ncbi:YbbR-like protein [compost metagenome]
MDSTIIENVKVQPYGLDESSYVLSDIDIERVRIEVKGKRSAITSIFNDDYKVILNLSEIKEGTFTVPLSHELPAGVELVSMSPDKVTVTIEKQTKASFPVTLVTTGTLSDGYVMGDITIEPNQVQVTLPESELENVVKVQGAVKLDGDKESLSVKNVKLVALDSNGQEVKDAVIEPADVSVQISLIAPSKKVPLNIQYSGKLPEGLVISNIQPNVSEVTLYGPNDVLSKIESYDTATVDLSQIDKVGKFTINANIPLPSGIEKVEPNPVQVEVEVVSTAETTTIDNVPIGIEGTMEGTQVTIVKPVGKSVSLTLTGAYELLNNLQVSDIKVMINTDNLKPGIHEVPLAVTLPQFITRVNETALMATVEVKDTTSSPVINDTDTPVKDQTEIPDTKEPVNEGADEQGSPETDDVDTETNGETTEPSSEVIQGNE